MTNEVAEETCDRCWKKYPHGSLARDTLDASMLFCASCQEVVSRGCAFCELDKKPWVPAIPGWLFGAYPDSCHNPACQECVEKRTLHRSIDTDRMSARMALQMLGTQLKKEGLEEEGLYIYEYGQRSILDESFQAWRWIPCYVVTGSNEGHYVHIDVLRRRLNNQEEETHLLATVKTFMGRRRAYEVALRCAELLGA